MFKPDYAEIFLRFDFIPVDFRLVFFALISFISLRKSASSCAVHSSDFVDRSTFFGSFIKPIALKFEISRNESIGSHSFNKHSVSSKMSCIK
jgi:hypothetical protein